MGLATGAALLTKIANTMSNPEAGQIVSFPTLAEGWDMREIAFDLPSAVTGISEWDSVNLRGAFARRVNSIPLSGDVWISSGTYLWDAYREVFEGAVILAEAPGSDAEEARVQAARTLIGPPGEPTPQYQAYLTFRDQCSTLELSLRHAQLTLASTTDPNVSAQAKADSDMFSEKLESCTQEWIVNGYKKEVEAAIHALSEFTHNPLHQWNSWVNDFQSIGPQNDSYGAFWPTGYRPDRLFDMGSGWIKFTLTGTEVASLAASAPPEVLRAQDALGDALRADGEIERMTMEMVRVDVERTWFHPELLHSRFWKWSNPDQQPLSSGDRPWPNGTLPGYIAGLVLVRNITISWKTVPHPEEINNSYRLLGNLVLGADVLRVAEQPVRLVATPVAEQPIHLAHMHVAERPTRFMHVNEALTATRAPSSPALGSIIRADVPINAVEHDNLRLLHLVLLPQPEPDGSTSGGTASTGDTVFLVAYIVQRTAKSPDPDPSLTWP
ncbi:hypothetical protein GK047_12830 [Paenibacillus sp. SYP-B3998]|uniref:Uncharacterized protein n=1 Tax=Paenibacillus sp. SYP-B3998 TaxID=2678564 RepID=A0A6G3ZZQ5_9BACL|nr:hypothetical protein [Paenibacillus sp. SYP-B3998]NEW06887.1 hypothetical protein [Paenibacillus sp. SYP-B3998]